MLVHQLATDRSNIRIVDGEHLDCDSADRRPAPQFDATPLEMILPNISARVEQAVSEPVAGSMPPILGPLWRLQCTQAKARLLASVSPPC